MSFFKKKPKPRIPTGKLSIEDDERRTSRNLVRLLGTALIAALLWAASFNLDEITRGTGKIIPSSREQVIQSLDSGVLAELLVREGDAVVKDQVLLRIDDARSGPVFREAREKWIALSAQAARLQAEAYGTPLQFPPMCEINRLSYSVKPKLIVCANKRWKNRWSRCGNRWSNCPRSWP